VSYISTGHEFIDQTKVFFLFINVDELGDVGVIDRPHDLYFFFEILQVFFAQFRPIKALIIADKIHLLFYAFDGYLLA
jgi:hypothetical protein